ncbi:hypothetical protein GCM10020331_073000 [Ectobacillus funiculus]
MRNIRYPVKKIKPGSCLYSCEKNIEEGFQQCENMLNLGGLGHTAVIHSTNEALQREFALRMKACRIVANAPAAQGGIGDVYNAFLPSLTLGCGSYGKKTLFLLT